VRITVFLGAPGSGKGTQAKRLAEDGLVHHFSTGDMLRAAIAAGSEIGLKAKVYIDKGELLPDDVMIELINKALKPLPDSSKVILDGFPRTVAQAEALDKSPRSRVSEAIMFEIPEEILVKRLTGRRVCKKCGSSFHVEFMPFEPGKSCQDCKGEFLYQRTDDSADVVGRRLSIFKTQNEGLLSYYSRVGNLKKIDANKQVDLIQKSLVDLMS
jgi:adenylate kinase